MSGYYPCRLPCEEYTRILHRHNTDGNVEFVVQHAHGHHSIITNVRLLMHKRKNRLYSKLDCFIT